VWHIIAFGFCAVLAIVSAFWVVLDRRAFYSGLALSVAVLSTAGLFALLDAPFLATLQVLIYAGAVIVLFLFVVWLLGIYREAELRLRRRGIIVGALLLLGLIAVWIAQIAHALQIMTPGKLADTSNVRAFGLRLFERYAFPFELTSLFLLIALIAAIYLARRQESS